MFIMFATRYFVVSHRSHATCHQQEMFWKSTPTERIIRQQFGERRWNTTVKYQVRMAMAGLFKMANWQFIGWNRIPLLKHSLNLLVANAKQGAMEGDARATKSAFYALMFVNVLNAKTVGITRTTMAMTMKLIMIEAWKRCILYLTCGRRNSVG